jgi:hypothetical protein
MAVGKFSKYPRKNKHKHIRMSKPDVEKERKKKNHPEKGCVIFPYL